MSPIDLFVLRYGWTIVISTVTRRRKAAVPVTTRARQANVSLSCSVFSCPIRMRYGMFHYLHDLNKPNLINLNFVLRWGVVEICMFSTSRHQIQLSSCLKSDQNNCPILSIAHGCVAFKDRTSIHSCSISFVGEPAIARL